MKAAVALLRKPRLIVGFALVVVIAACWAWIIAGAGMGMTAIAMTPGPLPPLLPAMLGTTWTLGYTALMFSMWWLMMLAMMLPSAAPVLLLHASVEEGALAQRGSLLATGLFAAAYGIVWAGFSVLATSAQWALQHYHLLSSMLASTSAELGAGLLIGAGVYQWLPVKNACLRHCRTPFTFFSQHWRPGHIGAIRMGLAHGVYCVGCCWFLMLLLFYGGIMNLYWVAGVAAFVMIEKLAPAGHWLGRLAGVGLCGGGMALLV